MEKLARELEEIVKELHFDCHLTDNDLQYVVYGEESKSMTLEKRTLHHEDITRIMDFVNKYNLKIEISVLPMENICSIEINKN